MIITCHTVWHKLERNLPNSIADCAISWGCKNGYIGISERDVIRIFPPSISMLCLFHHCQYLGTVAVPRISCDLMPPSFPWPLDEHLSGAHIAVCGTLNLFFFKDTGSRLVTQEFFYDVPFLSAKVNSGGKLQNVNPDLTFTIQASWILK